MATKVTKVSTAGVHAAIKRQMALPKGKRQTAAAAADHVLRVIAPKLQAITQHHYAHMLTAIGEVLQEPGIHSIDVNGAKVVRFRRYGDAGRSGRFKTQRWRALKPRYAASNPTSTTFWRKGRNLTKNTVSYEQLADLYTAAVAAATPIERSHSSATPGRPGRVDVRIGLQFGRLPVPLNRLLTSAFIRGASRAALYDRFVVESIGKGGSAGVRNTIRRVAWVEGARPFISGMAARMGRDMIKALKALK